MKKIFSILVSLLFLVSVFGVASLAGLCSITTSSTTVHVGDTFTITHSSQFTTCPDSSYVELVQNECGYKVFRAVKPGTITFIEGSNCEQSSSCDVTVTILPKEYPMLSFMKILGLGQTD